MSSAGEKGGYGGGKKERESWRVGMSDCERKCEKVSGRTKGATGREEEKMGGGPISEHKRK